ncbi:glucose-1-phosphate adenylyltransferase [Candidatus Kuenenia sp.]|uniref:glucose-1-phosphate adenylyltransferase n=1 Tax=Candidatus Kuenenia sp. TaxID=2499824 RepID=UPI0032205F36
MTMIRPFDHTLYRKVLVMLLAGGKGERLYPLTRDRAKPAVPFGGVYRIIDFTLSNCINSGLRKICVLTQYKSYSLDRHLRVGWNIFNSELDEFIENIPPQKRTSEMWYLGTSDAVYQNIYVLERERPEMVLILAGDHIYKMDYSELINYHILNKADLTVPCIEAPLEDASRFGVVGVDNNSRIIDFDEKPLNPKPLPTNKNVALVSMGIYLFNTEVLVRRIIENAKNDTNRDFGKNIIPTMIQKDRVLSFVFNGNGHSTANYWRDIGTLDAYWEANIDLVKKNPDFDLFDDTWPIRTYNKQYPPAKYSFENEKNGMIKDALISNGCLINDASIGKSIISPNVTIGSESSVMGSIIMEGVRIGKNVKIKNAIIDKHVTIPDGMKIGYDLQNDGKQFTVTEKGVVVAHKEMHLI